MSNNTYSYPMILKKGDPNPAMHKGSGPSTMKNTQSDPTIQKCESEKHENNVYPDSGVYII